MRNVARVLARATDSSLKSSRRLPWERRSATSVAVSTRATAISAVRIARRVARPMWRRPPLGDATGRAANVTVAAAGAGGADAGRALSAAAGDEASSIDGGLLFGPVPDCATVARPFMARESSGSMSAGFIPDRQHDFRRSSTRRPGAQAPITAPSEGLHQSMPADPSTLATLTPRVPLLRAATLSCHGALPARLTPSLLNDMTDPVAADSPGLAALGPRPAERHLKELHTTKGGSVHMRLRL